MSLHEVLDMVRWITVGFVIAVAVACNCLLRKRDEQ
jgi:hypothetical protein